MPGGLAWKTRYDHEFGASAYQPFSSYAYDATLVLAQAMMKAKSADPKVYLPFIRNTDYKSSAEHIGFESPRLARVCQTSNLGTRGSRCAQGNRVAVLFPRLQR